jgi:hypothetical protein
MNRELYHNAHWLIGAIRSGLMARRGEGVSEVLSRLAVQDLGEAGFREPEPRGLAVLAHLPQAIGETMLLDPDLAAAIAAVADELRWLQSSSYSDALLGEGFSANYGWAQIIGPDGFFPGDDFLLGLLMLGPERHYRDHYHPAPELYWPLTSGSFWSRESGPFAGQPQGAVIWHTPMMLHATKTAGTPLLAVWCWTKDVATPAQLKA